MQATPQILTDALGNEIVMGASYGYSTTSSGITKVVLGVADSVTKTGYLSLIVTKATQYIYGGSPKLIEYEKKKVSVNSCNLFPI